MENVFLWCVNDGDVFVVIGFVENVKYYVKRCNKVVGNCVCVDVENNYLRWNFNGKIYEEVVCLKGGNVRGEYCELFSIVKEVKDVRKVSKGVILRNGNEFGNNFNFSEGVIVLKRCNKIVFLSCINEVDENFVLFLCGLKEGVNDIERFEKDVDLSNVDDSGENFGLVKEVKYVKILKCGLFFSFVGDLVCMVFD